MSPTPKTSFAFGDRILMTTITEITAETKAKGTKATSANFDTCRQLVAYSSFFLLPEVQSSNSQSLCNDQNHWLTLKGSPQNCEPFKKKEITRKIKLPLDAGQNTAPL